jgi:hypothetical protein
MRRIWRQDELWIKEDKPGRGEYTLPLDAYIPHRSLREARSFRAWRDRRTYAGLY